MTVPPRIAVRWTGSENVPAELPPTTAQRVADLTARVEALEAALAGHPAARECVVCHGRGTVNDYRPNAPISGYKALCPACNGRGEYG